MYALLKLYHFEGRQTASFPTPCVVRSRGRSTLCPQKFFKAHFLGLASGDKVPDAKTSWVFKNQLTTGCQQPQ